MKKGARVYVKWEDISASLHDTEELDPAVAEVCGWVLSHTKRYLRLATCRYLGTANDEKDRITIPSGCVVEIYEI